MELTVIGVYDNATQAQQAVDQLVNSGFSRSNVDLSSRDGNAANQQYEGIGNDNGVGTFFNSLFDEKHDADRYTSIANQRTVVTVHTTSEADAERAADILDDNGAINVNDPVFDSLSKAPSASMGAAFLTADERREAGMTQPAADTNVAIGDQTIEVIEEKLSVGKRDMETGGVRVRSRIIQRPVEERIRLREEHVSVARTPVNRPATDADLTAFQEGEIILTEHAEIPVISKTANVVEEISVGKEVTERTETIRDTIRKTEVDVEQLGTTDKTNVAGTDANDVTYTTK